MRSFLAGLTLLLLLPGAGFAQAKGEVESIGFGSFYRPNCFVPMLIRVQAEKSGTYQIQVFQEDLDRDHQIFTQTVSLTGSDENKGSEQRFWMYFIPQPTDGGLPDTTRGGNLRDLQQQLKIYLYDEAGKKQLAQFPVTQTITNLDNAGIGKYPSGTRGTKLVLAVTDGSAQPIWRDYQTSIGSNEDVAFITMRSSELPEDVRGFDMVDAIVWLAAPLPDPAKPADEKRYHAIQAWVRGGGHLVVCQQAQRESTASIADMLPVTVDAVAPHPDLEPLKSMATERQEKLEIQMKDDATVSRLRPKFNPLPEDDLITGKKRREDWLLPNGPFVMARATAKPGAVVDEKKIKWPDGSESPYIARIGYGLGCVTWVAHDLSDPTFTSKAKSGWPYVWDRVLDFKNDLIVVDSNTPEETQKVYSQIGVVDVGRSLLDPMELSGKSAALVSIAVVFFIGYWVIAGPGVYLYLMTKSRQQLSWFLFALSAVVATAFTVLVVKLVVRGAPEMRHFTVIRGAAGTPQISLARFGLYIPRDGGQEITLTEVSPRNISYITAYPRHPKHTSGDVEFPAQENYNIPIHDSTEEGPVSINVPFRSTEKLLQARRVGPTGGAIEGLAKLREVDTVWRTEGLFTNGTGQRLRDVYMIMHRPDHMDDWVMYKPTWENGQTIDLADYNDRTVKFIGTDGALNGTPDDHIPLRGWMGIAGQSEGWSKYWFKPLTGGNAGYNERAFTDLPRSMIVMSLFGRLPPMRNTKDSSDRMDILRRGGRNLDMSNAVAAGKVVVLAMADDVGKMPIPFPMQVDGEKITGSGSVFYQFALPMETIPEATTQPGTPPATKQSATTQPTARASYNRGTLEPAWQP